MKRRTTRRTTIGFARPVTGALTVVALASASAAYAQDPTPSPGGSPAIPVQVSPPPPDPAVSAPPPPAAPIAPAAVQRTEEPGPAAEREASDLDVRARRWALGYMGVSQVPVGLGAPVQDITVPAIGVRYWTSPTVGIDVGIGLGWAGGSISAAGMSLDKDSVSGLVVHGGVPLALSTHRHVSFQVIPYASFASGWTSTGTGVGAVDFRGTRVDIGARSGLELFFGFIGIPELSLGATVGLQFEIRKYSAESGGVSQSDTTAGFSTTVQNSPWDIFAGNVAARYYL